MNADHPVNNDQHVGTAPSPLLELLRQVLRSFANATQTFAIYPSGHPSTTEAVRIARQRLSALLTEVETLSMDVMPGKMLLDEELFGVSETESPIANQLYRRHIARLTFTSGTTDAELTELFEAICSDQQTDGPEVTESIITPHISATPVGLGGVLLATGQAGPSADAQAQRPEELWRELISLNIDGARADGAEASDALALLDSLGAPSTSSGASPQRLRDIVHEMVELRAQTIGATADQAATEVLNDLAAKYGSITTELSPNQREKVAVAIALAAQALDPASVARFLLRQGQAQTLPDRAIRTMVDEHSDDGIADLIVSACQLQSTDGPSSLPSPFAQGIIDSPRQGTIMRLVAQKAAPGRQDVAGDSAAFGELLEQVLAVDETQFMSAGYLGELRTVTDDLADIDRRAEEIRSTHSHALLSTVSDEQLALAQDTLALDLLELEEDDQDFAASAIDLAKDITQHIAKGQYAQAHTAVSVLTRYAEADDATARQEGARQALSLVSNWQNVRDLALALHAADGRRAELLREAVLALGPSAADVLLDAIAEEEDRETRLKLVAAATQLAPLSAERATLRVNDSRWYVVRNMVGLLPLKPDDEAINALVPQLNHNDLRVCKEAIKGLAAIGGERSIRHISQAFESPNAEVRTGCIRALAAIDSAEATAALVDVATKKRGRRADYAEKAEIANALGRTGRPEAIPTLASFLHERSLLAPKAIAELAQAAAFALASLDSGDALRVLHEGATASRRSVRSACQKALTLRD